jgi:hypothetical protein
MAKKKRRGRSRASALSPINKQGIKLGTLLMEVGLGGAVYDAVQHARGGNFSQIDNDLGSIFDWSKWQARVFLPGLGIALAGRLIGIKSLGPLQLS